MRRLLFILGVLIMVSCCPTESVSTITIETNKEETLEIPSTRINVRRTGSYFYQFTYKGHEYITNCGKGVRIPQAAQLFINFKIFLKLWQNRV